MNDVSNKGVPSQFSKKLDYYQNIRKKLIHLHTSDEYKVKLRQLSEVKRLSQIPSANERSRTKPIKLLPTSASTTKRQLGVSEPTQSKKQTLESMKHATGKPNLNISREFKKFLESKNILTDKKTQDQTKRTVKRQNVMSKISGIIEMGNSEISTGRTKGSVISSFRRNMQKGRNRGLTQSIDYSSMSKCIL